MTQRIVVLTGAGISAESGIKTFRDSDGLWENHRIEDVATPEAFARNPEQVQHFYNLRRAQLAQVTPNAAHQALADFEQRFNGEFLLITQNVDNLHEQAGSQQLLHMHGELCQARCLACGHVQPWNADIDDHSSCQQCQTKRLRPNIVWFGEMPLFMDDIYHALSRCDVFISIGTSGHVYPAAGFVEIANAAGAHSVEINLEPSNTRDAFAEHRYGKAGIEVPRYLQSLGHL